MFVHLDLILMCCIIRSYRNLVYFRACTVRPDLLYRTVRAVVYTCMYMYVVILRLVDALIVTDSRLVIRVENMVRSTTSSLEDLEVDLNGAMSNYLRLALRFLLSSLLIF